MWEAIRKDGLCVAAIRFKIYFNATKKQKGGYYYHDGKFVKYTERGFEIGDTVGVQVESGTISFFLNGKPLGPIKIKRGIRRKTLYPAVYLYKLEDTATIGRRLAQVQRNQTRKVALPHTRK